MENNKERLTLTTRENYFKLKEQQCLRLHPDKVKALVEEYKEALHKWITFKTTLYSVDPQTGEITVKEKGFEEQRGPRPEEPLCSDNFARELNIIYSMLRGKSYKQIEQKVAEHNEPRKYNIANVLSRIGVSYEDFTRVCGEIETYAD